MNHLFAELDVAGLRLANRVILPPMATEQADEDGCPNPATTGHYGSLAAAGVALVVVEHSCVAPVRAGFHPARCRGNGRERGGTCRHRSGDPRRRRSLLGPDQPCRFEPPGGSVRKVPRPKRGGEPRFTPGPGGNVERRHHRSRSRLWIGGRPRS